MLKFYLTTVVIWMIIIYCTAAMFKSGIRKKISKDETKKTSLFEKLTILFPLAAVPIIRVFVVIIIIYIATCKQEDFDELMKRAEENNN